jgi:hypothetical protein
MYDCVWSVIYKGMGNEVKRKKSGNETSAAARSKEWEWSKKHVTERGLDQVLKGGAMTKILKKKENVKRKK